MTQTNPLQYRPNACPLCLTCLVCTEVYGKNCICPPKELKWQRKSNEYKIDFRHKPLDTVAARKQKIKLDNVFVNWFHSNISRIATCYTDIHIRKGSLILARITDLARVIADHLRSCAYECV